MFTQSLHILRAHPARQEPWNQTNRRWRRPEANSGENGQRPLKEEIKEAAGPPQVCAGHNAGAEAVIQRAKCLKKKEQMGFC